MLHFLKREPMSSWQILGKAIEFILRNIFWISLLGFLISIPKQIIFRSPALFKFFFLENSLIYGCSAIFYYIFLFMPVLCGMVIILMSAHYWKQKMVWLQVFKIIVQKMVPIFIFQLFSCFLIIPLFCIQVLLGYFNWLIGYSVSLILGLNLLCALSCVIPCIMLEDLGPLEACKRSCQLTKKNRFRIFCFIVFCVLVSIISTWILEEVMALGMRLNDSSKIIFQKIFLFSFPHLDSLLFVPFISLWPAVATLLYYDLLVRKGVTGSVNLQIS